MTYQELVVENQLQKQKIASLEVQLSQLYKLLSSFKSERFVSEVNGEQLNLFSESSPEAIIEVSKETITYTREKKKHCGRNALPEHLPVREIIIEPKEDITGLKRIGEEVTETLSYTPASLVKIRTIRPKYAKANAEGIIIGDLPSRPIDKCIAEACLLAHILVSKYVDHLPFYRQIQMFGRDFGWYPAASTLSGWMEQCCRLLEPLYNRLKQKILESDYIQVDESPIKVLESDKTRAEPNRSKGSTHQGYQWVYHDPITKLVFFQYRKGRGMHGPKELLADYNGYLQCDGYSVYDKIGKSSPNITLVGCLAHARRKFHDARDNDKARAEKALGIFKMIYLENRKIKQELLEKQYELRQEKIKPLFKELRDWIESEQFNVLPKSTIGKAMAYYNNQYPKLITVLQDPRLELDNNLIENTIRPMAIGRKNYLFCGSHKAAQNAAMLYSFFGSCKMQNINPREWLTQTLEKLPDYNIQNIKELLPGYQTENTNL